MGAFGFVMRAFREAPSKRRFVRSLLLGSKGGNRTVRSSDGTNLSVRVSGQGPPLVLVHGALDGMNSFAFIEPILTEEWTVWTYDRRGRGGSGDGTGDYLLQVEAADLAAIAEVAGGEPDVLGHSYGAIVAMRAALDGTPMRSLVLYEPPINGAAISEQAIDEIESLIEAGERDEAIRRMATGLAGVSDDEVAVGLAVPPVRKVLRDGLRSIGRELRTAHAHDWFELPIRDTPTLVLQGERRSSPAYPADEQATMLATDVQVRELTGQGHVGHTFAPDDFVDAIRPFLRRHL